MMNHETKFRKGACHGAQWLRKKVKLMAQEGRSATEVSAMVGDLMQVLVDWRGGQVEMPAGNPWDWSGEALQHFIALRKSEW